MIIEHEITLDASRYGTQANVSITQHDANVHRLIFHVRNGGQTIQLSKEYSAVLYVGDGKDNYECCTVYTSSGAYADCIVCDLGANVSINHGEHRAVLQIFRNASTPWSSTEIILSVREDITNGSIVLDSPQYAAVIKAQDAAEEYALQAEQAKKDAESLLNTKLDKYTRNEDVVYTHLADGRDDVTPFTDWYAGPSIMYRDSAGKSQVGTASDTDDGHTIVNKEYLAKVADTKLDSKANKSTFSCVYAVNSLGENTEIRYTASENPNTMMMRDAYGRANVETPKNPKNIVNKEYADEVAEKKLEKSTDVSTWSKAYIKAPDGSQTLVNITSSSSVQGFNIISRDINGRSQIAYPDPNSDTDIANVKFVKEQVAGIVNSAPETLDTLQELSKALGDDPNFATTVSTELGKKATKEELSSGLTENTTKSTDYTNKTHYGYSGDDLLIIPEGTTTVGDYSNTNYKCVVIPQGVQTAVNGAFANCSNLEKINIPEGFGIISPAMFDTCTGLSDIIIPNTVMTINGYAFVNCFNIPYIKIPTSVAGIGDYAFYNTSLEFLDLTGFEGNFPSIGTNLFSENSVPIIKVKKGYKSELASMTNWSAYASYIVEVPTVETVDAELENKQDKLPFASSEQAGIVKVQNKYGIDVNNTNGLIFLYPTGDAEISARSTTNRRAICISNLDYAVKAAMCDGKGAAWTDAEQAAARKRIGLPGDYELIEEITITESINSITRETEPDGTAYNFKKIVVVATSPKGTFESFTMYCKFYSGNKYVQGYTQHSSNETYYKRALYQGYLDGNRMVFENTEQSFTYTTQSSSGGDSASLKKSQDVTITDSNITKIVMLCSNSKTIASGYLIQIYGVRA